MLNISRNKNYQAKKGLSADRDCLRPKSRPIKQSTNNSTDYRLPNPLLERVELSNLRIIFAFKKLLCMGHINLWVMGFSIEKKLRTKFRSVESSLFHSIIIYGTKEFLKMVCLILKRGILPVLLEADL